MCFEVGVDAGGGPTQQLRFEKAAAVVQGLGHCLGVAQLSGVRQAGQQAFGAGAQLAIDAWVAGELLQGVEQAGQRGLTVLLCQQLLGNAELVLPAAERHEAQ
ncbi:hypothetical protein D3C76_1147840 [compost metagenome]